MLLDRRLPIAMCHLALVACGNLNAQSPANTGINPDRPGYSDGTGVLGIGMVHFESGSSLIVATRSGGLRDIVGGSPVFRIGLTSRIEARLGADGAVYREARAGYSDIFTGAKIRMRSETRWLPALTLIPLVSIPTGSRGLSSGGLDPTLKISWSKAIAWGNTVAGNYNISSISDGQAARFRQTAASVQLSRPIWSEWSGFGEVYAISLAGSARIWAFDGGLTRQMGPNLQADLSFGRQTAQQKPVWFVAVGMVVRSRLLPR